MTICTDYRILYLSWQGWQQVSHAKQLFPEHLSTQYRMHVCGTASATLLKVEGNIRIMIQVGTAKTEFFKVVTVKPRIVESLHTQAGPEQSHDLSFRKTGQLISIVSSTAVFCISIVPKVQIKHITSKRFQLLLWRCNETKRLKEKIT